MTSPVAVLPLSQASAGSLVARVGDELRAVIVVKATFQLIHDGDASLTTPRPLVEADAVVRSAGAESLLEGTDLVPAPPGAGVVVTGRARAPRGSTREMAVRVGIYRGTEPKLVKQLLVVGDRADAGALPAPFAEMPIVYERAYGGPSIAENPVGVGWTGAPPLPNVIDPRASTRPGGLGAIARSWAPRAAALASLRATPTGEIAYLRDFDFGALHAAPRDQWLSEPLHGDEWIVLDGFHAQLPRVQSQLPRARAEARLSRKGHGGDVRAIELTAGTLLIDADVLTATVVFRGHVVVADWDAARALRAIVGVELSGEPIRWPAASFASAATSLPAAPTASAGSSPRVLEPPAAASEINLDDTALLPQDAVVPAVALPFVAAGPADEGGSSAGRGPDLERPVPRVPVHGVGDTVTAISPFAVRDPLPFGAQAPAPLSPVTRPQTRVPSGTGELDRSRMGVAAAPFFGREAPLERAEPPVEPPVEPVAFAAKEPEAPAAPRAPAPPEPSAAPGDLRAAIAARRRDKVSLRDLDFAGADLTGIDLSDADLRDMQLGGACLRGANLTRASLRGARLVAADLAQADLTGANATGADLAGADLRDARLEGATLSGCNLAGARGPGVRGRGLVATRAKLGRSAWDGADFTGATLDGADFSNASLVATRFVDAGLAGASFVDAAATDAVFDGARLADATFNAATLVGASFTLAEAPRARFERAKLERARFDHAVLEGAHLTRASAQGASFASADLRRAQLQKLDAPACDLSGANLRGAELRQAKLEGAQADEARFQGVEAAGVDLRGANLRRADARAANLRDANLTGADLEGANLDDADLRAASLGDAKLTGVSRRGTKLDRADFEARADGEADA